MTGGGKAGGMGERADRGRRGALWTAAILAATLGWIGGASHGQEGRPVARLSFTKVLKGSSPEYMSLTVDVDGAGTYDGRSLADPASPHPLQISRTTTQHLFSLAQSLGNFRAIDLESRHKVADLGRKTFVYESGGETNRVEFNYTENRAAQELTAEFEKIATVEQHITQLDYAIKYDPLSLPEQLRQIQIELSQHELVEVALLAPTLEKITTNSRFLHLAQSRAQAILERIRDQN